MTRQCCCEYSSDCRIYEINSISALPEDEEFVHNFCNGPDRTYCPIFRYHETLRNPVPQTIPKAEEVIRLHFVT